MIDTPMFPDFDEFMEAKAGESALNYEVRWLKKLYAALHSADAFKEDNREAGDEFGFHWYNDTHSLPIKLYASRLKDLSPAQILRSKGMTRTPAWKDYFEHKSNHPKGEIVGLIFPVNKMQHFIFHNMFGLEPISGVNRVVRVATNPDNGIIIEPVDTFFKALARMMGSAI